MYNCIQLAGSEMDLPRSLAGKAEIISWQTLGDHFAAREGGLVSCTNYKLTHKLTYKQLTWRPHTCSSPINRLGHNYVFSM